MSKLETNTIDTISGSTTLTLGGTNATTIAQDSATTITGLKSTGIDDNATSTAITIDSNENVGIGETSPLGLVHIKSADSSGTVSSDADELVLEGNTNAGLTILGGTGNACRIHFGDSGDNDIGFINYAHDDNALLFGTNAGVRMIIDSSGDVLVGLTAIPTSNQAGVALTEAGLIYTSRSSDATLSHHAFFNTNGEVGNIRTAGSSTSYNTTSDYRLKENVNYDFDATTRLKQLKPARFNFIADANTTVDGFIAHEVQTIVPEAISGEKDATETKEKVVVNANGNVIAENIEQADWEAGKIADEDGNTKYPTDSTWEATKVVPVYQGIDQSKLVPLLVKTIQELEARIATLETKVTTLENA